MKNVKFTILALAMAFGFVACNDDSVSEDYAKEIAGTYNGTLTWKVGSTEKTPETSVVVTQTGENLVTVTIYKDPNSTGERDFNYDIPVEKVEVKKDGSIYTLAKTAITQIINNKGETIESTGSLWGTITEGKIALNFNFKPGAMPMDIECTFEGKLSE